MSTLNIEKKDQYAIVTINNGKVNAVDTPLVKDLKSAFTKLATDKAVRGVILKGRPHCFSAGLDVVRLATNTMEQSMEFWQTFIEALHTMIRFPKPLVCAITGFAPAAGTAIALCADYRIMAKGEKHVMGLHEFKMSMMIPEVMGDLYGYHMGEKQAWEAIQNAKLFNSDEAVKVGLANESVEVDEVMPRAEKHLAKLLRVHNSAFAASKRYMRHNFLKLANKDVTKMMLDMRTNFEDPNTRKMAELFLAKLKK